ncbi:MAG: hypothetical protein IKP76_02095 [Bacilli bacterium]|nr:hypothetical protein [Bacilli bacterium]
MNYIKEELKCPSCNKKLKVKVYNSFNESKITDIINKDIFKVTCNNCNESFYVDYPFELDTDKYHLFYTPYDNNIEIVKNKINRVCNTFDDLREKILIFEDDLNDIVIEYLKAYVGGSLKDDNIKDIRFDSIIDNRIIFALIGIEQNAGIDKSIYDELLKKAKIKDNIVIDQDNYKDYIKVG